MNKWDCFGYRYMAQNSKDTILWIHFTNINILPRKLIVRLNVGYVLGTKLIKYWHLKSKGYCKQNAKSQQTNWFSDICCIENISQEPSNVAHQNPMITKNYVSCCQMWTRSYVCFSRKISIRNYENSLN